MKHKIVITAGGNLRGSYEKLIDTDIECNGKTHYDKVVEGNCCEKCMFYDGVK